MGVAGRSDFEGDVVEQVPEAVRKHRGQLVVQLGRLPGVGELDRDDDEGARPQAISNFAQRVDRVACLLLLGKRM